MRWWMWVLAGLLIGYLIVANLTSSYFMTMITARPMDLVRGDQRVSIWLPSSVTEIQPAGTARIGVGTGTLLGLRMSYVLPDGSQASCKQWVFGVRCRDVWQVEFPTVTR